MLSEQPRREPGRVAYPADRRKPAAMDELGVDFSRVVIDLARALGIDVLALRADICRSSIRNYMDGSSTPLHPPGERLIRLWRETLGTSREELPTRRIYKAHRAQG